MLVGLGWLFGMTSVRNILDLVCASPVKGDRPVYARSDVIAVTLTGSSTRPNRTR